jgi:hypothetical protein
LSLIADGIDSIGSYERLELFRGSFNVLIKSYFLTLEEISRTGPTEKNKLPIDEGLRHRVNEFGCRDGILMSKRNANNSGMQFVLDFQCIAQGRNGPIQRRDVTAGGGRENRKELAYYGPCSEG